MCKINDVSIYDCDIGSLSGHIPGGFGGELV
jgi:hypothetical protein